nr:CHAT domain-containing protein [Streptomyces sp. S1D4-11]
MPEELDALERALPRLERLGRGRADRRALMSLDGPVDVLHLACHAEFDAHDPLLSRLYLSDGPVYGYGKRTCGCVRDWSSSAPARRPWPDGCPAMKYSA